MRRDRPGNPGTGDHDSDELTTNGDRALRSSPRHGGGHGHQGTAGLSGGHQATMTNEKAAPPLTDAVWFELVNVPIGNATPQYPNGDQVQTVRRWYPSSFWQGLDITVLNKILDNIDAGPYDGGRYSPAPNAKERAAWPVILKFYPDLSEKQAKSMIATWIKNGVLEKRMHEDPNDRHEHASLFVGKRPGNSFDIKKTTSLG